MDQLATDFAKEIKKRTALALLGDPLAADGERPGQNRLYVPSGEDFTNQVLICRVNQLRTANYLPFVPPARTFPAEYQQECTITIVGGVAETHCEVRATDCPGNMIDNVCGRVIDAAQGGTVELEGVNYFDVDAKVRLTPKDLSAPGRDIEGSCGAMSTRRLTRRSARKRCRSGIAGCRPPDVPGAERPSGRALFDAGGHPEQYGQSGFRTGAGLQCRILERAAVADGEISGHDKANSRARGDVANVVGLRRGGPEDHRLRDGSSQRGDGDPRHQISGTRRRRIRQRYAPRPRPRHFRKRNAVPWRGVAVMGHEIDSEWAYNRQIDEWEDSFIHLLEVQKEYLLALIALTSLKYLGWKGFLIGLAAGVFVIGIDLLRAIWAPADPIIDDLIDLSAIDLDQLVSPATPIPPVRSYASELHLRIWVNRTPPPPKLPFQYTELREYLSAPEMSRYELTYQYNRLQ